MIRSVGSPVNAATASEEDPYGISTASAMDLEIANEKADAMARLLEMGDYAHVIAFCNTKNMTDRLVGLLQMRGISCQGIHGDIAQSAREKTLKKFRDGQIADAIWGEITWWVILIGLGLMVLKIGNVGGVPVVLCVGGVMLLYGSTYKAKGFGKVTALIGAVYNGVSGYFSDILSYARLMALMLAGAVIAQVFNTLGSVTGNVVVFMIISMIGNALNLALNLLGCYVHDLRLQCLEFFGRFYKEGGRQFRPMAFETKYVDIKEEN
mgnify:CR=1 FL=1